MKKFVSTLLVLLLLLSACAGGENKLQLQSQAEPEPQTKEELLERILEATEEQENVEAVGSFDVEVGGIPIVKDNQIQLAVNLLSQKEPLAGLSKMQLKTDKPLPMFDVDGLVLEFYVENGKAWTKKTSSGGMWTQVEGQDKNQEHSWKTFFGLPDDEKEKKEFPENLEMKKEGENYKLVMTNQEELKERFEAINKTTVQGQLPEGFNIPEFSLEDIHVESLIDGKTYLVKEHRIQVTLAMKGLFNLSLKVDGNLSYQNYNSTTISKPKGIEP